MARTGTLGGLSAAVILALASCGVSSAELSQDWVRAVEARDAMAVSDLFAVDARLVDPALESPANGRVAIYAAYSQLFSLPDVAIVPGDPTVSRSGFTIDWVWTGVRPDTGVAYRVEGVSKFLVKNGLITEERAEYAVAESPLG